VIKNKKPINYHIFSSIWSSIKEEYDVIVDNSVWLIGNGEHINFWNDNWCGVVLSEHYNIPSHTRQLLTSTVSDYLSNGCWNIPSYIVRFGVFKFKFFSESSNYSFGAMSRFFALEAH
jgi:hypothetical protein